MPLSCENRNVLIQIGYMSSHVKNRNNSSTINVLMNRVYECMAAISIHPLNVRMIRVYECMTAIYILLKHIINVLMIKVYESCQDKSSPCPMSPLNCDINCYNVYCSTDTSQFKLYSAVIQCLQCLRSTVI